MKPMFRIRRDETSGSYLEVSATGRALHEHSLINKGTAFTQEERDRLGLAGYLPPRVADIEEQVDRVLGSYRQIQKPIDRYTYLHDLMDRNETLFYRILVENIEDMLPVVYTPTVGEACRKFGRLFRRARGIYITMNDVQDIDALLDNWITDNVEVIVVTDGERILGLGDLGSGGMGIGIGKLSLYVAGAGIHPGRVLPICIDVGTDNEELLNDPLYLGVREKRIRGPRYLALVDAFMEAVSARFPRALIQFEDFATVNAIPLLARYRDRYRCFNDDIQGTAAVAAAGVIAAARRAGKNITDLKFVMGGAGGAAVGISELLILALMEQGASEQQAVASFFFVDSRGLIYEGRGTLSDHKQRFARTEDEAAGIGRDGGGTDLTGVVRAVQPDVLIGASGQAGLFNQDVIEALAAGTESPVVFMLSNPTSKAECTPTQAIEWSAGKAIVATGSPFDPVTYQGTTRRIGQANNVFIFPGLGLGVLAVGARRITDALFITAMNTLGDVAPDDALYPAARDIRTVSREIAIAVARRAIREGLTDGVSEDEVESRVDELIWEPRYLPIRVVPAPGG